MSADMTLETTAVVVCGCGPTGAMLSGYLGRMGIPNIVLEKEDGITTDPRGIALDDDGIRFMQGLGLYQHIFTSIGTPLSRLHFVGGVHSNLHAEAFLSFDLTSTEGRTGHVGAIGHKQPVLESHLRSVIEKSSFCQLRSGCTVTSIEEDEEHVFITYTDPSGAHRRIRALFLAAADGKTGYTRKNYLEPRGIRLEWAEKTQYEETWVALNWKISLPTRETHPDFPLWKRGYSPQEVYDLFFPSEFRFLCNPERPAVCGRFGLPEDRLWRFEFVVAPGEDGLEMAKRHNIERIVFPYITLSGKQFSLTEDVRYPEDCIDVLRSRPFRFSARSCNKWALGRTILCGDAAHVFPPFGGQGIASGFRDAAALAWRLALLCSPNPPAHDIMLESWYKERKQQLDGSLATTVRNGNMVNSRNPFYNFLRDWVLWAVQRVPSWKAYLELGPRADPHVVYKYAPGMPFLPEFSGGRSFPQTYCTSLVEGGPVQFTDSVIFGDEKTKMFQIVVLLDSIEAYKCALDDVKSIERTNRYLLADEATYFVPRDSTVDYSAGETYRGKPIFRTASAGEFAQSALCIGRPPPRGYDELLMWETVRGKRYVILRPDRFVFAACQSRAELQNAARKMEEILS